MAALIVVSDFHMGAGPLDDFEPEVEKHFCAFLEEFRSHSDGTKLVINGDLLDFVQAPPYKDTTLRADGKDGAPLCFTEDQSLRKLAAIVGDHADAFAALREFLAYRPENQIVIMPGNHDPDFYWSGVQKEFRNLLCGDAGTSGQLTFWLDTVYRPADYAGIWIEHGHQYDEVNRFFIGDGPCWSASNPPISPDRKGTRRLHECIGTRFLLQFLNDLDRKYPFVDNVKPFWRFLQIFGASALRPGLGSVQAAVAVAAMQAYLARTLVYHPRDVLRIETDQPTDAVDRVRDAYQDAVASRQRAFVESIVRRGYPLKASPDLVLSNHATAGPLMEFLADNLDLLETIDREPSGDTLDLARAFTLKESDDMRGHATRITAGEKRQANTVIMGHTHEVVDEPGYINTGSWTRYYQVQPNERLRPWSLLRAEGWKSFPYQLNYAIADAGPNATAQLRTYRDSRSTTQA